MGEDTGVIVILDEIKIEFKLCKSNYPKYFRVKLLIQLFIKETNLYMKPALCFFSHPYKPFLISKAFVNTHRLVNKTCIKF